MHQDTKTHIHTVQHLCWRYQSFYGHYFLLETFALLTLCSSNPSPTPSVSTHAAPQAARLSTDELAGERPHSVPVFIYAICLAYANTLALHHPVAGEMTKYSIVYWHLVLPWKQDAKVDINLQNL